MFMKMMSIYEKVNINTGLRDIKEFNSLSKINIARFLQLNTIFLFFLILLR